MIVNRIALLALVALAPALAGCGWFGGGGSNKEAAAAAYCPTPLTVQDAGKLTRFKDGGGRDPRDVAFEAVVVQSNAACSISRNVSTFRSSSRSPSMQGRRSVRERRACRSSCA